jgi:hypothetical protein
MGRQENGNTNAQHNNNAQAQGKVNYPDTV